MQVREIESYEAFNRLRPEWTALWERSAAAGPFQHPEWLLAWWRHFGGGELFVLAVRDGDDLVALAPFFIYSDPADKVRQLTLIGNGISDSCDILIDPCAPSAAQAIADRLLARRDCFTSYDLRDVPVHSALVQLIINQFGGSASEDVPCVVIGLQQLPVPGSGPVPGRVVADLRRCQRRAEELATVRIELASMADISDALDGLFSLHALRWQARGEGGVLNGPELKAFYREVAGRFADRNWLRLYRLSLGNRLVAANYGFCLRSRAYSYIGGFDPEFASLSPGKMIVHHAMSEAAAEGAVEFDLLRGGEDYKYRWGGRSRMQYRLKSSSAFRES